VTFNETPKEQKAQMW